MSTSYLLISGVTDRPPEASGLTLVIKTFLVGSRCYWWSFSPFVDVDRRRFLYFIGKRSPCHRQLPTGLSAELSVVTLGSSLL